MASAQVLRKQEQLAAGRRKLEEFRRKKSAEKAKKGMPTSLLSNDVLRPKKPSESELVHTEDNGVGTFDAHAVGGLEPSDIVENNEAKESDTSIKTGSSNNEKAQSFLANESDDNSSALKQSDLNDEKHKSDASSSGLLEPGWSNYKLLNGQENDELLSLVASGIENDSHLYRPALPAQDIDITSSHSKYHDLDCYPSNNVDVFEKDLSLDNPSNSSVFANSILPEDSGRTLSLGSRGYQINSVKSSSYHESFHSASSTAARSFNVGQRLSEFPNVGENVTSSSVANSGVNHSSSWASDYGYNDFTSDTLTPNYALPPLPAAERRFRSSFPASFHISKGPTPPLSPIKVAKSNFSSSKVSQKSATSTVTSGYGVEYSYPVMESIHDFFPQKPNEDFAALEQHIEDLTQEKFALQRGLEASRALAESLASENSALTDSFNHQGSIVHQLKVDLERLQEEIKVQLVELEAVKLAYADVQLECNAADERAKLLASEVIGLEEKVLRLRSNELKLEKQVENYQSEIFSYRKKISSLEKEHQDLQLTIDALQEEKKQFQFKLRKAWSSGKSMDTDNTKYSKKDESTSTEDLDADATAEALNSENFTTASLPGDGHSSELLQESRLLGVEGLYSTVPYDQMRIIESINTLIAELATEKDQLVRALSAKASQSSTLLELNKELTRKLEAQTQRLELLTAQRMSNDSILPRQPDPRAVQGTIAYADEGDEVVERVLGWIMKLFPEGPSRRRTSKRFSL